MENKNNAGNKELTNLLVKQTAVRVAILGGIGAACYAAYKFFGSKE